MTQKIGVVALVLIVGLLAAYFVLNQKPTDQNLPNNGQQNSISDLQQLGTPLSTNASESEKDAFVSKLRSLAKSSSIIYVGQNCALSPEIVTMTSGSELTFMNEDNTEHRLSITEEIVLAAGTEQTVEATFNGPGVYGITCDGPTTVGYIDLME